MILGKMMKTFFCCVISILSNYKYHYYLLLGILLISSLMIVIICSGFETSYTRATPSAFHDFVNRPQKQRAIHKTTKMLGS